RIEWIVMIRFAYILHVEMYWYQFLLVWNVRSGAAKTYYRKPLDFQGRALEKSLEKSAGPKGGERNRAEGSRTRFSVLKRPSGGVEEFCRKGPRVYSRIQRMTATCACQRK